MQSNTMLYEKKLVPLKYQTNKQLQLLNRKLLNHY